LIRTTPRSSELKINPIDAFVAAQETDRRAFLRPHAVLNQQVGISGFDTI
jgi:hypothetical protein